ncbi:MAG: hypothetical protein ACXVEF_43035, partial [Polyangiales bacterium]
VSRKALALASSIAIVGCSSGDEGSVVALYGAPYDAAADTTSSGDSASTDSGSAEDSTSGTDSGTDSGTTEDSGSDVKDTGGPLPPYGLPPSDGG